MNPRDALMRIAVNDCGLVRFGAFVMTVLLLFVISTLYDRIETRLTADPTLAAAISAPPRELRDVEWLVGRWRVESHVFGRTDVDRGTSVVRKSVGGTWLETRDTYDGREADVGYLTYNTVARRWVSISIDKTGNSVRAEAERWDGKHLVFIARDAEIVGERVTLRQTLEKRSNGEYRLLNEEQLPDGTWARIDEYVYTRID